MWERFADVLPLGSIDTVAHVVAQVPAALLGAALTLAMSIGWFAGESWTEDKVDEGVRAHVEETEPRLERIEANSRATRANQAEFRRDIDVIKALLGASIETEQRTREALEARSERMERLIEQLVTRQMEAAK